MAQLLSVGGTTIKNPTSLKIEKYYLSKAGRTADGMMHIEKISNKLKFLLRYDSIKGSDLDTILGAVYGTAVFFTLSYKENDVTKTATVYVGAIHQSFFRNDTGANYFRDVAFDLIQQ